MDRYIMIMPIPPVGMKDTHVPYSLNRGPASSHDLKLC
jgi:hypothetical protein